MSSVDVHAGPLMYTGLIALCALYLWQRRASSRRLPLPPGPKGLPLIGNFYDMPTAFEWKQYARWGEEYDSDIIYLDVVGSRIVVVNSYAVATDLFEKRSSIYSSRPETTMTRDLVKLGWIFGLMKYGDRWKERRKLFQHYFHPQNTDIHQPKEQEYIHNLLKRLHKSPERFMEHIRHVIGAITITIAYGLDLKPSNDPYVEIAENAMAGITLAAVPGAFLVDSIPVLKYVPRWFPGASFKRKAYEWNKWTTAMVEVPFYDSEKAFAMGTANPSSFVPMCLRDLDEREDIVKQRRVIMDTAGNFFVGAADTSVSSICTFMLQMTLHPEIQAKAHAELDRVMGRYTLPTFSDEASLPYIGAIVKEVLRWHTITPLALPHFADRDDEYNGYLIPKGSIVMGNAWAMLHDKRVYEDPHIFCPERFLTSDGLQLDLNVPEPDAAFGFGRRACPGRHMATSTLYMAVVSILSVFEISKALNEDGNPITPSGEYTSSLVSHPLPFRCTIKPRSAEAEDVITAL